MRHLYTRWRFFVLIMPLLVFFTIYTIVPMLVSLGYSFTSYRGLGSPKWNDFANYKRLINDKYLWLSLRNSLFTAMCMLALIMPISFMLAYSFRKKKLINQVYQTIVFAPYIIPSTLSALMWYFLLNPSFGLINSMLGKLGISGPMWIGGLKLSPLSYALTASWANMGFYVSLWSVALKSISSEVMEASLVDGCNRRQQVFSIILPMIRENIGSMIILVVTSALKIYEYVYMLTGGGPNHASETIISYMYTTTFESQTYGYGMTIGVVEFIIAVLISLYTLSVSRKEK